MIIELQYKKDFQDFPKEWDFTLPLIIRRFKKKLVEEVKEDEVFFIYAQKKDANDEWIEYEWKAKAEGFLIRIPDHDDIKFEVDQELNWSFQPDARILWQTVPVIGGGSAGGGSAGGGTNNQVMEEGEDPPPEEELIEQVLGVPADVVVPVVENTINSQMTDPVQPTSAIAIKDSFGVEITIPAGAVVRLSNCTIINLTVLENAWVELTNCKVLNFLLNGGFARLQNSIINTLEAYKAKVFGLYGSILNKIYAVKSKIQMAIANITGPLLARAYQCRMMFNQVSATCQNGFLFFGCQAKISGGKLVFSGNMGEVKDYSKAFVNRCKIEAVSGFKVAANSVLTITHCTPSYAIKSGYIPDSLGAIKDETVGGLKCDDLLLDMDGQAEVVFHDNEINMPEGTVFKIKDATFEYAGCEKITCKTLLQAENAKVTISNVKELNCYHILKVKDSYVQLLNFTKIQQIDPTDKGPLFDTMEDNKESEIVLANVTDPITMAKATWVNHPKMVTKPYGLVKYLFRNIGSMLFYKTVASESQIKIKFEDIGSLVSKGWGVIIWETSSSNNECWFRNIGYSKAEKSPVIDIESGKLWVYSCGTLEGWKDTLRLKNSEGVVYGVEKLIYGGPGAPPPPKCPQCGSQYVPGETVCPVCGYDLTQIPTPPDPEASSDPDIDPRWKKYIFNCEKSKVHASNCQIMIGKYRVLSADKSDFYVDTVSVMQIDVMDMLWGSGNCNFYLKNISTMKCNDGRYLSNITASGGKVILENVSSVTSTTHGFKITGGGIGSTHSIFKDFGSIKVDSDIVWDVSQLTAIFNTATAKGTETLKGSNIDLYMYKVSDDPTTDRSITLSQSVVEWVDTTFVKDISLDSCKIKTRRVTFSKVATLQSCYAVMENTTFADDTTLKSGTFDMKVCTFSGENLSMEGLFLTGLQTTINSSDISIKDCSMEYQGTISGTTTFEGSVLRIMGGSIGGEFKVGDGSLILSHASSGTVKLEAFNNKEVSLESSKEVKVSSGGGERAIYVGNIDRVVAGKIREKVTDTSESEETRIEISKDKYGAEVLSGGSASASIQLSQDDGVDVYSMNEAKLRAMSTLKVDSMADVSINAMQKAEISGTIEVDLQSMMAINFKRQAGNPEVSPPSDLEEPEE